jgi:hypothetical protein
MGVQKEARQQSMPLLLTENFPEAGGVGIHNVADDARPAGPTVLGRLPSALFGRTKDSDREASPGNNDGLARLLDFIEKSETLGFELSGAHDTFCHAHILPEKMVT